MCAGEERQLGDGPLFHHFVMDHTTLDDLAAWIMRICRETRRRLPEPFPFRTLVAHARLGVSREEHEAFFREMLGDVRSRRYPLDLPDVQGDGRHRRRRTIRSTRRSRNVCERVRVALGVSAASVCHLAWARVLSALCGRDDVVFGTMVFGRMQGGASADRALGMFMNALPFRVKLNTSVEVGVRRTHEALRS